jgi:NADPH:quinone reductase
MKAVFCENYGLPESLIYKEVANPSPGPGEVVINVKACGVNFPDVLIIQNKYQFKPPLPFSPGGEVSGIIEAVGENVKHLEKGTRVLALTGWGGFAEQVVINARRVFPIPAEMDFVTASSTLYTYGTSYHALKDRAQLKEGETLLVLGAAGGVGLAAVELGKFMGAKVIAAASTDDKLQICKQKGADYLINYSKEDLKSRVKEITGDNGVNVVYDPIGGDLSEQALRTMAWKGRYLVVGFASGEIPKFPMNLPLLKGCAVLGVFWGSFAEQEPQSNLQNFKDLLNLIKAGKIKQHIHNIYQLEEASKALQDLLSRQVMGKAVVKIGEWTEDPLPINEEVEVKKDTRENAPINEKILIKNPSEFKNHKGKALGPTDWLMVDQEMINKFADATQDRQWVHVDTEKAKMLLPDGKTLAHGYLTLSMAARFLNDVIEIDPSNLVINFGVNKARFLKPVQCGSRIRSKAKIQEVEEISSGGVKVTIHTTIEIEGSKSACIAELICVVK